MGAMIPLPVMAAPSLSSGAKLCYGVLCRFAGQDGACYPSEKSIADAMQVSDRTARNYIRELVEHGYIERERAARSETNRYFFLWRDEFNEFDLDRKDSSSRDRKDSSSKESHLRENTDFDYQPANRAERDLNRSGIAGGCLD